LLEQGSLKLKQKASELKQVMVQNNGDYQIDLFFGFLQLISK